MVEWRYFMKMNKFKIYDIFRCFLSSIMFFLAVLIFIIAMSDSAYAESKELLEYEKKVLCDIKTDV